MVFSLHSILEMTFSFCTDMDMFLLDILSIDNVSVVNPITDLGCLDAVLPLLHDE